MTTTRDAASATRQAEIADDAAAAWMRQMRHGGDGEAAIRELAAKLEDPALSYKRRAACTVLRPRFMAAQQVDNLRTASTLVLSAINKVERTIVRERDRMLKELGVFGPLERRLLNVPVKLLRTDISVRLDGTMTPEGWGFFELNGAIPGGLEIAHELTRAFEQSRLFKGVQRDVNVRGFDVKGAVIGSLMRAYREWGGDRAVARPTVALVDFIDDAPLYSEFVTFSNWMEEIGCRCILADPGELDILNDRLVAKGEPIDIVYRRLVLMDMVPILAECEPLVAAAEQGLALIVDPFFASVLDRKSLFALVSNPAFDFGFTPREREAVRASVPYTRLVREEDTVLPDGQIGSLLDWCRRERASLVLKPNHDFGGHGVSLGWTMKPSEWDVALEGALHRETVVQHRLPVVRDTFPHVDDPLSPVPFEVSTDPFMFSGELGGILCRLSAGGLSNVTAGGSIAPTFVVHDS